MSDSLRPYGLWPTRLLCPWNSPGRNIGVVAVSFFRGSSQPGDRTHVSCIGRKVLYHWTAREVPLLIPSSHIIATEVRISTCAFLRGQKHSVPNRCWFSRDFFFFLISYLTDDQGIRWITFLWLNAKNDYWAPSPRCWIWDAKVRSHFPSLWCPGRVGKTDVTSTQRGVRCGWGVFTLCGITRGVMYLILGMAVRWWGEREGAGVRQRK